MSSPRSSRRCIAPYGEAEVVGKAYQPWSGQHLLGTDQLGRDMLSRLIYGARNTIGIALLTTLLSFALGGGARPPGGHRRAGSTRC